MYEINKIYNENSLEAIKKLPNNCVDLIITDPPYSFKSCKTSSKTDLGNKLNRAQKVISDHSLSDDYDHKIWPELIRIMKKINMYIWCSKDQLPDLLDFFVIQKKCSYDLLIWNKTNPPPTFYNKYLTDKEFCLYIRKGGYCNPVSYQNSKTIFVQPINSKDKKQYDHPTIKPLNIIETLIQNSSKPGDLIFDPFIGSGTTAVAAIKNNRNFLGFEIDYDYFKICTNRIENEAKI